MPDLIDEGATAPDFTLETEDGATVSLKDTAGDPLVVGFVASGCEKCKAYEDRIGDLADRFADRGTSTILVDVDPGDGLDELKGSEAVTYALDPDREAARAYGPDKTPHFFVFDGDLTLRYDGRFDDAWRDPARVMRPYVEEALEVLYGERDHIEQARTLPIGRRIEYKDA